MIIISLEGLDGCGKTTQFEMLLHNLSMRGHIVNAIQEPAGGSDLGRELKKLILYKWYTPLDAWAEAYMFMACRAQNLAEVNPNADIMLCDRYIDSSVVYQGHGNGLGMENIWNMSKPIMRGYYPDTTFYIKVPYQVCLQRVKERGEADRIEQKGEEYFKKLEEGYDLVSEQDPNRWIVVDGTQSPEDVQKKIVQLLMLRYTKIRLSLP